MSTSSDGRLLHTIHRSALFFLQGHRLLLPSAQGSKNMYFVVLFSDPPDYICLFLPWHMRSSGEPPYMLCLHFPYLHLFHLHFVYRYPDSLFSFHLHTADLFCNLLNLQNTQKTASALPLFQAVPYLRTMYFSSAFLFCFYKSRSPYRSAYRSIS